MLCVWEAKAAVAGAVDRHPCCLLRNSGRSEWWSATVTNRALNRRRCLLELFLTVSLSIAQGTSHRIGYHSELPLLDQEIFYQDRKTLILYVNHLHKFHPAQTDRDLFKAYPCPL
jgi:hypothetical protein